MNDIENGILAKAATGKLAEYVDYIKLFFSMLKDTFTGKYKEIPKGTIASIVGTLLYVFSPVDIILDAIPIIGLVDDAAIVALCIKATENDVKKYKIWKETSAALGNDYKEI